MKPEEFLNIVKSRGNVSSALKIGTIPNTYVTGRPTVMFDGESIASTRTYPYLSSYAPVANDRVLIVAVGHGGVILGKII